VADWNENPKPFIWTKIAEQILESLAPFVNESQAQDTDQCFP
jgi:hypothetical protein